MSLRIKLNKNNWDIIPFTKMMDGFLIVYLMITEYLSNVGNRYILNDIRQNTRILI